MKGRARAAIGFLLMLAGFSYQDNYKGIIDFLWEAAPVVGIILFIWGLIKMGLSPSGSDWIDLGDD